MAKAKKKRRRTLSKAIAAIPDQPGLREEIIKYGRHVPGIGRIERWQRAIKERGVNCPMVKVEQDAMLSLFMGAYLRLDDAFFDETANAIRAFKEKLAFDKLDLALTNPALWICHPPATPKEIAIQFGLDPKNNEVMTNLRKKLERQKVPHKKVPRGRPQETARNTETKP
jgi:hypothetical protein